MTCADIVLSKTNYPNANMRNKHIIIIFNI